MTQKIEALKGYALTAVKREVARHETLAFLALVAGIACGHQAMQLPFSWGGMAWSAGSGLLLRAVVTFAAKAGAVRGMALSVDILDRALTELRQER